ncbi:MAG: hypothetical protein SFU20_04885 [Chitinophagaceae bacterium]|nr:hypothetical protein [Chitinophagaceae bacterium]
MSKVTNLIVTSSISENVDNLKSAFLKFLVNGRPFDLVSIENENAPQGWYGGSKFIEANIFIGAYNELNLEELIHFMRNDISWESPELVQLIFKKQNKFKFEVIDLFPELPV